MSEFLKALELADQERARNRGEPRDLDDTGRDPVALAPPVPFAPRVARVPGQEVDDHLVSLLSPASMESDHYRVLRDVVEQRRKSTGLVIAGVTSPGAGDGKTTTAVNLAGALAQDATARVLLIDADLRNASVADRLGLGTPHPQGLTDALLDPALSLEHIARRIERFNLSVVDSGRECSTPYEVLRLPRLGELLAEARQRYDHVIVDVPPAIPFPDCRIIARWLDGLVLVVAAHRTSRRLFEEALKTLDVSRVAALVFNGDDNPVDPSSASYYSRHYARERAPNGRGGWRNVLRRNSRHVA